MTLAASASTSAAAPDGPGSLAARSVVQNPWYDPAPEPVVIDLSPEAQRARARALSDQTTVDGPTFEQLDAYKRDVPGSDLHGGDGIGHQLPEGLTQIGGMVVPEAMLDGADMVPDVQQALSADRDPQAAPEFCAFPDEVPPGVYDYEHRPGGEIPRFHTVYLNYLGGTLTADGENSAENKSGIARSGHPYPVYGGGETKAIAVAQAVQADLQDWAVRVVYLERPPKVLPYTMVMMGGHYSDTTAGPSGGVAPLDCEDFGQRNVCYVFQNGSPATSQANIASQEIGHTLGLGHTSAPDSVMAAGYAPTQGGDLGFNDSCAPTIQVSGQSASCVGVNKCHCGEGEAQHDKNTLFATFAPAGVDMTEPTISIATPEDGAIFQEGEDILVEFDPWDDVGGYGWKLIVEDEQGEVLVDQVDYDRALFFNLKGVPVGTYTLTALIQDHADHVVTHTITITVEGEAESDTDSGTDGETDSMGDTDGGDAMTTGLTEGDGSGGGGSDTDDAAAEESATGDDGGCGCRTADDAGADPSALAGLGLLGLRRRRRADVVADSAA